MRSSHRLDCSGVFVVVAACGFGQREMCFSDYCGESCTSRDYVEYFGGTGGNTSIIQAAIYCLWREQIRGRGRATLESIQ